MECPFIFLIKKISCLSYRQEIEFIYLILVDTMHLVCILNVFCRDRV